MVQRPPALTGSESLKGKSRMQVLHQSRIAGYVERSSMTVKVAIVTFALQWNKTGAELTDGPLSVMFYDLKVNRMMSVMVTLRSPPVI